MKTDITYIDRESPQYSKINALYTHIFRDVQRVTFFDRSVLNDVEKFVDDSHVMFLLNVRQGALEHIMQARQLLLQKLTPTSIMIKRLGENDADVGNLNNLPILVKDKVLECLKNEMYSR